MSQMVSLAQATLAQQVPTWEHDSVDRQQVVKLMPTEDAIAFKANAEAQGKWVAIGEDAETAAST
jgi:hypothetical protein